MRTELDDGTVVDLVIVFDSYWEGNRWNPPEGEFHIDTIYGSNGERLYIDLTDAEWDRFEREYMEWLESLNDY
jgi:hypothetical protein